MCWTFSRMLQPCSSSQQQWWPLAGTGDGDVTNSRSLKQLLADAHLCMQAGSGCRLSVGQHQSAMMCCSSRVHRHQASSAAVSAIGNGHSQVVMQQTTWQSSSLSPSPLMFKVATSQYRSDTFPLFPSLPLAYLLLPSSPTPSTPRCWPPSRSLCLPSWRASATRGTRRPAR
jgi:hypothetical protein